MCCTALCVLFFFFNDTATTEIYTYCHTLSLHDALPICWIWLPLGPGAAAGSGSGSICDTAAASAFSGAAELVRTRSCGPKLASARRASGPMSVRFRKTPRPIGDRSQIGRASCRERVGQYV